MGVALGPCAFIATRCRRAAADEFCGHLQSVAVLSPRWFEVRRRRHRLSVLGAGEGLIEVSPGCFVHFAGLVCNFVFFVDLPVICTVLSVFMNQILFKKKKKIERMGRMKAKGWSIQQLLAASYSGATGNRKFPKLLG